MNRDFLKDYNRIRNGGGGYYEQRRGLIEVWGKEAVQFLNGLITNDVAALEDGGQMLAALPNVQGRLLAIVRVLRNGDRFFFETDEVTHEKVFQNLFRFTFAGDFFVEDVSENFRYFEVFGSKRSEPPALAGGFLFTSAISINHFVPVAAADAFRAELEAIGAFEIPDELYEILRIENGVPKYGVDMDESTVVLETGLDEAVSFTKGCYIGQEIIARIHFRGHVAKQLTGLILSSPAHEGRAGWLLSEPPAIAGGLTPDFQHAELKTIDGKNAGKITSVTFSPTLGKTIALAFVRYDYLAEGTELRINERTATVKNLPFL